MPFAAGCTFFDVDVAGGAGADAATGVVEEDVIVFCDVEEALGQAVAFVGERVEGEFYGAVFGQERDADDALGGGLRGIDRGCFGVAGV
jgi:hypothetical protein